MARQRRRLHACGTGDERIRRCRIGRARFVVRSRWHPAFWTRNRGWSGRSCHRSRIRLDVVRAPAGSDLRRRGTSGESGSMALPRPRCGGWIVGLAFTTRFTLLRALSLDRCCGRVAGSPGFGAVIFVALWLGRALPPWMGPLLLPDANATPQFLDSIDRQRALFRRIHLVGLSLLRSVSIDCSDHSQFSPVLTDWTKGGVEEMSLEQLVERLADATDRRSFLKRLSAATLGFTFGALGLAEVAHAAHCCQLCKPASSSCSGCACTWCWNCCDNNVSYWRCCECFNPGGCCCRGCYGAKCSYVTSLGGCPPQLLPEAA